MTYNPCSSLSSPRVRGEPGYGHGLRGLACAAVKKRAVARLFREVLPLMHQPHDDDAPCRDAVVQGKRRPRHGQRAGVVVAG